MSSEHSALLYVGRHDELLQLFFLAVVVLSLNANDDCDGGIDSDTIEPTVAWLLDRLNDDVNGSENQQELKGAISETFLDDLEKGSDFRYTLGVGAETNRNI